MRNRIFTLVAKLLFVTFALEAVQIPSHHLYLPHPELEAPWFTGPLLAPSSITIPPGHFNIEPYVFIVANKGRYNEHWHAQKVDTFWNNYQQTSIQFGLTSWLDFAFYPTIYYNHTKGASKWVFGDMQFGFDVQLYRRTDDLSKWGTALLLRIQEIGPFGRYQNLNPKKKLTDAGGLGSWQTQLSLVWGNLFYVGNLRFVTWRNAFLYSIPAPVHVKNLNAFGGGPGTRGKVYPAQFFQYDTAIEINFTKNWAFAMDLVGSWYKKVRFKGTTAVPNSAPAAVQFSLAPAIEYNWSANLGLIFGCWFSFAGKNSKQFVDGVVALNYFH